MVWLLGNNFDYEKAKEFLPARFPFLEYDFLYFFLILFFDYFQILSFIVIIIRINVDKIDIGMKMCYKKYTGFKQFSIPLMR